MKQNGPWKIIKSEVVYESPPFLTVRHDEVIRPDGQPGTYSVIVSDDAIHVLPVDKEANCYLVEEFKYGLEGTSIQTVGGYIEKGETPEQAVHRELAEEGGIKAERIQNLGLAYVGPSSSKSKIELFAAVGLTLGKNNPEATEVIALVKVPLKEAVEMVHDGRIKYGIAGLLVLKAADYLARHPRFLL